MADEARETHLETDRARGGSTPNIVRWVLGISLAAAVIAMSAIWIFGAASMDEHETAGTVDGPAAPDGNGSGSDTDSIVSDNADSLAAPAESASSPGDPLTIPNAQATAQ